MRYRVLACDYDGTIAHHGRVADSTVEALERCAASGRVMLLVTGRELTPLLEVCPRLDLFARVVLENGGVLYDPASGVERLLGEPPPAALVDLLRARGVTPLSVGRVIVAAVEPYELVVLETIRELGLEHQLIFNKGAVMVLPSGVNKATGLLAATDELGLSPDELVGVGDGENDHAFLSACGVGVAVANALPSLRERADLVLSQPDGAGVIELVDRLLADDLQTVLPSPRRGPGHG